jgi:2-amino-4-hydroxy-6-hydroxymethyldihydropteridine diphosphokinase
VTRVFISIGSNIDPAHHVREAILRLASVENVIAISMVYRTPAEGRPDQPPYYNCVVAVEASKSPMDLKSHILRPIEQELGRTRSADKFAARTIDLDLIWYDRAVATSPNLTLPDPQILKRPFLAVPLSEIAPDLVFPNSGMSIRDLAARMRADDLEPLEDYTDLLRRESIYERERQHE